MVVAMVALFVSLSGVSYGVATGFIDSREIRNNTVRSTDLRNNSARSVDIRNNDIRGRDIRNSTIRGSDIGASQVRGPDVLESSLGIVPRASSAETALRAATAGSAASLSSQRKIAYQAAATSAGQTIYDSGRLKLTASCTGSVVTVNATTSVDNATIQSAPASGTTSDSDFDRADTVALSGASEQRTAVYTEPGGQVVVVEYAAVDGGPYGGAVGCIVKGLAQTL
jgi:hypothetical protein